MSNKGKWDTHYTGLTKEPFHYGESAAYEIGARAFIQARCKKVEDWGCGGGWFKQQLYRISNNVRCVAIDGSCTPHADVVEDLLTRQTKVDGIFMRGVLEHNYDWPDLLVNVMRSFTKRLVLATFTPFIDEQVQRADVAWEELRFEDDYGVPTLSLNLDRLMGFFDGLAVDRQDIESYTFYNAETIFIVDKP